MNRPVGPNQTGHGSVDPPRLQRSKTSTARLLARYARDTSADRDEAETSWHQLRRRLAAAPTPAPPFLRPFQPWTRAWVVGVALSAALGLFALGKTAPLPADRDGAAPVAQLAAGRPRLGRGGGASGSPDDNGNRGAGGMEGASGSHGLGGAL